MILHNWKWKYNHYAKCDKNIFKYTFDTAKKFIMINSVTKSGCDLKNVGNMPITFRYIIE